MRWHRYLIMENLEQTLEHLGSARGSQRIVAGGTDLLVQIRAREAEEPGLTLLDISSLEEIRGVRKQNGTLVVGAATTMNELASSPLIRSQARALAQGAGWLGSPQIRNVATVGGNVVTALPAGDAALPLVALGAKAILHSPHGRREISVEDLYQGVGKSVVDPSCELITHFHIPAPLEGRCASAMMRLAKRKAFTLPQLSAAVCVTLSQDGRSFESVRIVCAPVADRPWRARSAEALLQGAPVTIENLLAAASAARDEARPRSSLRAGREYRREMVAVLVKRALTEAVVGIGESLDA